LNVLQVHEVVGDGKLPERDVTADLVVPVEIKPPEDEYECDTSDEEVQSWLRLFVAARVKGLDSSLLRFFCTRCNHICLFCGESADDEAQSLIFTHADDSLRRG